MIGTTQTVSQIAAVETRGASRSPSPEQQARDKRARISLRCGCTAEKLGRYLLSGKTHGRRSEDDYWKGTENI